MRKDPRNGEIHKALHEHYKGNPNSFIKEFLCELKVLRKEGKEETIIPRPDNTDVVLYQQTWENTIHKERVQPLQYIIPTTKEKVIEIVKTAEANGHMVRAVGKGHSFSDVANATDVLVDTLGLDKELTLETDTFKAGTPTDVMYCCEGGMLVKDLNKNLDDIGLAIPTMAAFDQETIYGAIATSTHGTGIRVPGMSDMLKSMDMVAAGGKVYRLEPTNGITDPEKFKQKHSDITLIQDDDKFHSTVVGFGLMGIVYSVVLEVKKTFYLKQRLWITNWSTLKPKLLDRSFFHEIDPEGTKAPGDEPTRAQFFFNPYQTHRPWDHNGPDHTCCVQVQTEITKEEYDKLIAEEPKKERKLHDFIEEILTNGGYDGTHTDTIAGLDKETPAAELPEALLVAFMNKYPEMTPIIIDLSLVVLLSGSGKIGKSYIVMNQGKLVFKNSGYSVEPGFGVDDANNFVQGVEKIMEVAGKSAESHEYLSSPNCARFVQPSHAYMSPEYSENNIPTCMVDVPAVLGTMGDDQMMDRMQKALMGVGAKPHWGKICNLVNGRDLISKMYPKFQQFLDTVAFFNPNGTFNSEFSYRTGISEMKYDRD